MGINRGHGRQGLHTCICVGEAGRVLRQSDFWNFSGGGLHSRLRGCIREREKKKIANRLASAEYASLRHRGTGSAVRTVLCDRQRIRHRRPYAEINQTCSCWPGMARQNAWPRLASGATIYSVSKLLDAGQQMGLSQCDARERRRNKGDSPWSASRRLCPPRQSPRYESWRREQCNFKHLLVGYYTAPDDSKGPQSSPARPYTKRCMLSRTAVGQAFSSILGVDSFPFSVSQPWGRSP